MADRPSPFFSVDGMNRLPAPEMPFWISQQLPFDRYMVEVGDGLRMHVMEQGHGKPVLALHGNPTWGYLYRKVAAELEGEPIRLIMPDLIGFGFSDAPASTDDHTFANHSDWVAGLLDQLGLDEVVAVVADWGGPIGLHALSRRPGLMTGVVLLNTSAGPPRPGFKPTRFHRIYSTRLGALSSRLSGFPQHWIGWFQHDRKSLAGVVRKSYVYAMRRAPESFIALVRMVPDNMEHPSIPLLKEVGEFVASFDGPAAIVWGDNDPVLGRLRRRHERALPHATVTATPSGHFVQEEAPAEVARAITTVVSQT